jgi:hypothetical protein
MITTGVSGARHALAKSGSIFSTAAMRLASFRVRSVWFRLDFDPTLLNHFSRASVGSEMCVAKELQAAAADSLHLRYSWCALSH